MVRRIWLSKKLFEDAREEYTKDRARLRLIQKAREDIEALLQDGLKIDWYWRISPANKILETPDTIEFKVPQHLKDWDSVEDYVADLSIKHGIPFVRNILGGYGETAPTTEFASHKPIRLPRSGADVRIKINCGRFIPPECHVQVERHRTWSQRASYRTYCRVAVVLAALLAGCAWNPDYIDREQHQLNSVDECCMRYAGIQRMCAEDAFTIGFAANYFGMDRWKEMMVEMRKREPERFQPMPYIPAK